MSSDSQDLEALLLQLESEERELSELRRKLQERVDIFPNDVTVEQERAISNRRRELHAQIDAIRAERRGRHGKRLPDDPA
jgi:hypothetical protein